MRKSYHIYTTVVELSFNHYGVHKNYYISETIPPSMLGSNNGIKLSKVQNTIQF